LTGLQRITKQNCRNSSLGSGVDAFTEYWDNKFGLFVIPIVIIHRVINKVAVD
jgi:hypothetical protein